MKSKYIHTPPFPSHIATEHYKRSTDWAKQFIITTCVGELTFGVYALWVKEFHSSKLRLYFRQYGQRSLKRAAWGVSTSKFLKSRARNLQTFQSGVSSVSVTASVRSSRARTKFIAKGAMTVQNSGAFCLKMSSSFQPLEVCV